MKIKIKKFKEEIFEAVAKKAPNIDLYLVNENQISTPKIRSKKSFDFLGFLKITGVLLLATFIAFVFHKFNTQPSNIVMIFILAVFASSFISDNKIFAFYSSLVSVLIYNFFFLEPIFSLKVHDSGNIITFTTITLPNAMYLPIEDGKKLKGSRYSFKRKTSLARLSV